MRTGRILLTMGVAVAAAAGGTLATASASGGGGAVAQSVLGSGSDTTQKMMSDLSTLYQFSPGCAQIPTPSGPTPWLDFSCQSGVPAGSTDPPAVTTTGHDSVGSSTISVASTAGLKRGQQIEGPGINASTWPQGLYVGSIGATYVTISSSPANNDAAVAGTGAGSGTFFFSDVVKSENYEHDQVTSAYFNGSSNGIHQLCNASVAGTAHIDYARSSRAPKINVSGADCTGLHFVAYAQDGISWEAFNVAGSGIQGQSNTEAPCTASVTPCLTQTDLQNIFVNCTVNNWSQVGGANVPINPYTAQAGSGTRSTFDSFLHGSSDTCINQRGTSYAATHIIPENNDVAIVNNGDQANAIFPFSYGIFQTQNRGDNSGVLGAVDNIKPSATTITNGSFPYSRLLYNVYCGATDTQGNPSQCAAGTPNALASTATVNFVGEEGWLCKPQYGVIGSKTLTGHVIDPYSATHRNFFGEIQSTISNDGFAPLVHGTIGGGDTNADFCRLFNT